MVRTLAMLSAVLIAASPGAAEARPRPAARPAASASADSAYFAAKDAYAALKKDAKRRKYRDQWLAIAERFEAVARKHPKSPRAPEALYNAADLYAELSRVSLARKDLDRAIATYQQLYKKYPSSTLADDAHLLLARIYRDRRDDRAKAREELIAAVKVKGDMRDVARRELVALGFEAPEARPEPARNLARVDPPEPVKVRAEPPPAQARSGTPARAPEAAEAAAAAERTAEAPSPSAIHPKVAAVLDGSTLDEESDGEDDEPPARAGLDPNRLNALESAARAPIPLSVQVGLKVRRVVIDPGHGGRDTGAIGPTGVREKDVTLAISKKLKARLEQDGYEVLLTRDSDRFVPLDDRARFANRKKGDLFVSVHCNAHKNRKMRGTETYTLNVTSDRYAIRLAARENASSERKVSDLQFILADLATRANTEDSTRLARAVQNRLVEVDRQGSKDARNLGVKQALFYVLLGARMPSVLVETAFISNPRDEKRLADPAHQEKLAAAIAEGVVRFTAERDAMATAFLD